MCVYSKTVLAQSQPPFPSSSFTLHFSIYKFSFVFTGETFDQLALFSDGEVIGQIAASLDVEASFLNQKISFRYVSLIKAVENMFLGEFCVENVQREVQPYAAS